MNTQEAFELFQSAQLSQNQMDLLLQFLQSQSANGSQSLAGNDDGKMLAKDDLKFLIQQIDRKADKDDIKLLIQQMDKRFELMQQQMDKRFEQVDKRFEQVDKRFELMQQQMDKGFEALTTRMDRFMVWSFGSSVTLSGLVIAILKWT